MMNPPPLPLLCALLVPLLLPGLQEAVAAPITFNTALPVARDEKLVRIQTRLLRSTDDPSGAQRDLRVWSVPVVAAYGVTEKLALFALLPILDKKLKGESTAGRLERGDSGIGDVQLLARYTLWQKDAPGKTIRLAPFVALKMPTGEDEATDSAGKLPPPLQLGSGSWDYSVGLVLTRQSLARQLDASIGYSRKGEANAFEFGDAARLDLSYQHRLWPGELTSGVPAFVYAVLESNLLWQDNNINQGSQDNNSGGLIWYLTPGMQYVTKRTVLELAVQVPVVQNLNGSALKNDFITTLSFRINF